jgi:hypothetical protein
MTHSISRHSVVSKWCKYELALAMADELVMPGVKVLPVKVGSVQMPPVLRNKVYRSVETLGTEGTIRALVEDIEKHRSRLSEAVTGEAGGPSPTSPPAKLVVARKGPRRPRCVPYRRRSQPGQGDAARGAERGPAAI